MEKGIVITKEDFDNFKEKLLAEVKAIFETNIKREKWICSKDVREMLGISDATLQTLRINKTILAYKLDATWFYKKKKL